MHFSICVCVYSTLSLCLCVCVFVTYTNIPFNHINSICQCVFLYTHTYVHACTRHKHTHTHRDTDRHKDIPTDRHIGIGVHEIMQCSGGAHQVPSIHFAHKQYTFKTMDPKPKTPEVPTSTMHPMADGTLIETLNTPPPPRDLKNT